MKVRITKIHLNGEFLEFKCTPIDASGDTELRNACGKLIKNADGIEVTLTIDIENTE